MNLRLLLPRLILGVAIAGAAVLLAFGSDRLDPAFVEGALQDLGVWAPYGHMALFAVGTVIAAKAGQKTPDGYYTIERILKRVLTGKGEVLLCGTCMDARGLADADMMPGASRSTMDALAAATASADKVLVF